MVNFLSGMVALVSLRLHNSDLIWKNVEIARLYT